MNRLRFVPHMLVLTVFGLPVIAGDIPTYTLDDCLQLARASNRTIKMAELRESAQEAHRSATQADYLPKVEARGLYYGSFSDPLQGFLNGLAESRAGLVQVGMTQPITQLIKIRQGVKVADAEFRSSKADHDVAEEEIAKGVRQVYWKIVELTAQQKAIEGALVFLEAWASDVRSAETAGKVLPDAVLEVQSRLLEARRSRMELQSGLELAHFQLAQLIGLGSTTDFRISTEFLPDRFGEEQSAEPLELRALQNRGEVCKAEADACKAGAALGFAKTAYLPDVAFTVSEIRQTGYQFVPVNNHGAGVLFNWTLYDFGKREAEIRERRLTVEAAQLKLEDTREKVRLEVRQALHSLHTAEEAEAVAQAQVKLAAERLRIANDRNQVGKMTQTDVLEARMRMAIAEAELTAAQSRVSVSAAELRRATGEN